MWKSIPRSCAHADKHISSSTVYSVPSSVDWVTDTTPGCTTCSSPIRTIRVSASSGVSLPSGVGTVRSLIPPNTSGAPHSSTFRCAESAQITPCHGRNIARNPTTFAPVPLKTGNTDASAPKRSRASAARLSVHESAP